MHILYEYMGVWRTKPLNESSIFIVPTAVCGLKFYFSEDVLTMIMSNLRLIYLLLHVCITEHI